MLARMISDRWQQQHDDDDNDGTTEEEGVFIDRNGVRFQYVLDYMRDQKVHSAIGASGASIRKELEYFGFDNIPADAIDVSSANLEVAEIVVMVNKEYKQTIDDSKTARDGEIVAHWIYKKYMNNGSLGLNITTSANHVAGKAAFLKYKLNALIYKLGSIKNRKYGGSSHHDANAVIQSNCPSYVNGYDSFKLTINKSLSKYGLKVTSLSLHAG
mmetsp:Transcript_10454/g.10099  ORF Transcript_10454/g.10099 Transcript_10454/m.10099 type:complete len:214 (+) Transcript_10454:1080-1721(+)